MAENFFEDFFFGGGGGNRLKKKFEDLFFEITLALVSLAMASRGSVLGRAIFGLGLRFFWYPWPRVLCPRLHLWHIYVQCQRWSPRGRPWPGGHILKSLASKVKSLALASRP